MLPPVVRFADILEVDRRYAPAAYDFVFEALQFGQRVLSMGSQDPGEEHHVTGQELCEAIRLYAIEQYGYMAKLVFNTWGVRCTGDFGEIVFNLIRSGKMKKTDQDRREDFEAVFDFETDLRQQFRISLPDSRKS